MKVWVIMGNDYPNSVFSNEEDAEAYVKRMKAAEKKKLKGFGPHVYWRSYDFELEGREQTTS